MSLAASVLSGVSILLNGREEGCSGYQFKPLKTCCCLLVLIDFLEEIFLHLLYALKTISRNLKWLFQK